VVLRKTVVPTFEAAEDEIVAYRCSGKRFLPIFLASFVVPSLALHLVREVVVSWWRGMARSPALRRTELAFSDSSRVGVGDSIAGGRAPVTWLDNL
jgi:hypothetical protein